MNRMRMFEEFTNDCKINFQKIAEEIPDSDSPSETCRIFSKCGKMIYVEGWCDRCFSNYGVEEDDREAMIEIARQKTYDTLKSQPNLPQNKQLRGYKLTDWKFIELPENQVNYAVSIGVYEKINDMVF